MLHAPLMPRRAHHVAPIFAQVRFVVSRRERWEKAATAAGGSTAEAKFPSGMVSAMR
jgi:hypothetical protein